MRFYAFMVFIQNLVECVCHYARRHATCQNNPYVILYSVKRGCLFMINVEALQIPPLGGQVKIFNHFLEIITFFHVP